MSNIGDKSATESKSCKAKRQEKAIAKLTKETSCDLALSQLKQETESECYDRMKCLPQLVKWTKTTNDYLDHVLNPKKHRWSGEAQGGFCNPQVLESLLSDLVPQNLKCVPTTNLEEVNMIVHNKKPLQCSGCHARNKRSRGKHPIDCLEQRSIDGLKLLTVEG